jgi:hypothetical protein
MHYASMCFERESRGRAWEARTDVDPGGGAAQVREHEHEAPAAAPAGGEGGEHPAQVGLPFLRRLRLVPAAGPNPHGAVHRLRVLLLRLLVASSSFRLRLPPLVAVGSSSRCPGLPW